MPPRKSSSCSTFVRTTRFWRSALGPVSPSNCCCSAFPPDPSPGMVRQAAARNADALRNRRVDLRYGSAERLPFAEQTFDKALAINSMQAWPDTSAGLREIWRVLKHGGIVVLGFTVNSGQPKHGV